MLKLRRTRRGRLRRNVILRRCNLLSITTERVDGDSTSRFSNLQTLKMLLLLSSENSIQSPKQAQEVNPPIRSSTLLSTINLSTTPQSRHRCTSPSPLITYPTTSPSLSRRSCACSSAVSAEQSTVFLTICLLETLKSEITIWEKSYGSLDSDTDGCLDDNAVSDSVRRTGGRLSVKPLLISFSSITKEGDTSTRQCSWCTTEMEYDSSFVVLFVIGSLVGRL